MDEPQQRVPRALTSRPGPVRLQACRLPVSCRSRGGTIRRPQTGYCGRRRPIAACRAHPPQSTATGISSGLLFVSLRLAQRQFPRALSSVSAPPCTPAGVPPSGSVQRGNGIRMIIRPQTGSCGLQRPFCGLSRPPAPDFRNVHPPLSGITACLVCGFFGHIRTVLEQMAEKACDSPSCGLSYLADCSGRRKGALRL